MHVAIDISPLSSDHAVRGTGVYTKQLVESLKKFERDITYTLFTQTQNIPKDADLVHFPYFSPFFLTLPKLFLKPFVVTVHDLIPLEYPDKFPSGIRGSIKWQLQKRKLRNAKRIITDSLASKNAIYKFAGYPDEKIDVVYLAASEEYSPIESVTALESIKSRYDIPKKYVLYVGDVNWNKNVNGLLKAWSVVKSQPEASEYILMLIGRSFRNEELEETKEILSYIRKNGLTGSVIMPGYVPETDLAAFYSLARAAIVPSFAEGFGLPAIEAMSCSCPVLLSKTSSLIEIAGPSMTMDPKSPKSIADGIMSFMTMTGVEYQKRKTESREWSKQYSWEKTAHETARIYQNILG